MNIQTDRALLPANTPAVRYMTVTVTAPDPGRRTDRPSVNVALVLDRSGSMGGRKFNMARTAVDHAIRLLDARDRLALVCYDHEIDVLLAATPATPEAKALALKRLKDIDARGNTDLCGGWMRGMDEIAGPSGPTGPAGSAGPAGPDGISRVLLLSDGLANQGETDQDVLARRAAEFRARGISTSTFGLGADFDERLMSRLATDGGGHFYFIEQPGQIADFLKSELGEALEVVARDARVVVSPAIAGAPGVQITALNDFPVELRADGLHIRLGDLVAGQDVTAVIALRWDALPEGANTAVALRLTDQDNVLFPQPMRVDWLVVDAEANRTQPVNTAVLAQVAQFLTERARAEAVEANRRGDFDAARRIMADAVRALRDLGAGIREVDGLIVELEEQDQARFSVAMSAMARKQVFYQSANLRASRDPRGKARKRA